MGGVRHPPPGPAHMTIPLQVSRCHASFGTSGTVSPASAARLRRGPAAREDYRSRRALRSRPRRLPGRSSGFGPAPEDKDARGRRVFSFGRARQQVRRDLVAAVPVPSTAILRPGVSEGPKRTPERTPRRTAGDGAAEGTRDWREEPGERGP